MQKENRTLSCEEVNGWDLVHYLSGLGFEPAKIRNNDYWYLSPLRTEHTPSFKVYRKGNVWYDHGIGKGGTLVDFCCTYFSCEWKEVLQRLTDGNSIVQPLLRASRQETDSEEKHIHILASKPISAHYLKHYLFSRNIPLVTAQEYCKEVVFSLYKKEYSGIGFLNRSGGFEIRNPAFKGSSSPKDISLLQTGAKKIAVFEGFFDFLSYQSIVAKTTIEPTDLLVLNSLSFAERALPILESYSSTHFYLDLDNAGKLLTQKMLAKHPSFHDESHLFKGFKDLNEWHGTNSTSPKRNLRQHL